MTEFSNSKNAVCFRWPSIINVLKRITYRFGEILFGEIRFGEKPIRRKPIWRKPFRRKPIRRNPFRRKTDSAKNRFGEKLIRRIFLKQKSCNLNDFLLFK